MNIKGWKRREKPSTLMSTMKYLITIAFLICFTVNNASQVDLCDQLLQRILQTLQNESCSLTDFNFSSNEEWSTIANTSLISVKTNLAINNQTVDCDGESEPLHAMFDIFIEDFRLEGDITTTKGSQIISAHFQTSGEGMFSVALEAMYMKESKKILIKTRPGTVPHYSNNYNWSDSTPELDNVRVKAQDWVNSILSKQFPDEFNFRLHKIIFENAENITRVL